MPSDPARIARVDGRVGLDEILEGVDAQLRAPQRRDDAHRHRLAHAERIADGQHHIPHGNVVVAGKADGRQPLAIHLQHGQIGVGVAADQACLQPLAAGQNHFDLRAVAQHVMVGEDVTVTAGNHARPHVVVGVLLFLILFAQRTRWLAPAGRGVARALIHRGCHAVVVRGNAHYGRCGPAGRLAVRRGGCRPRAQVAGIWLGAQAAILRARRGQGKPPAGSIRRCSARCGARAARGIRARPGAAVCRRATGGIPALKGASAWRSGRAVRPGGTCRLLRACCGPRTRCAARA